MAQQHKEHHQNKKLLITKRELAAELGFSMQTLYKKMFTEKLIKSMGFESLRVFKGIKTFDFEQTKELYKFIDKIKQNAKN